MVWVCGGVEMWVFVLGKCWGVCVGGIGTVDG